MSEMEDFIKKLKDEGEKTFILHFEPDVGNQRWLTEAEMAEEHSFTAELTPTLLKESLGLIATETEKDIRADIHEIKLKREELFKQLKSLHEKEAILVAQSRALDLQRKMIG